jgi:hypothetical protein
MWNTGMGIQSSKQALRDIKIVIENLRILKCCKTQRREIIETTRVSNTAEEPFKAVPDKTNAQVLPKTPDLLTATLKKKLGPQKKLQ